MIRTALLTLSVAVFSAGCTTAPTPAQAGVAKVGSAAPDFTLSDTDGNTVKLSSLKGKVVALEWFNPDCPFIVSAHNDGPLKTMPSVWTDKGVVWLTINSNAAGKQGHGQARNARAKDEYGLPSAVLLDEDGSTGKAYGAKTTPQMYLIDKSGTLVYAGGLDNAPRGEAPQSGLQPWFEQALAAVTSGKAPSPATTKPYGCSVKYAD